MINYEKRQQRVHTIITIIRIIQEAINNNGVYSCSLDFDRLDQELFNLFMSNKENQSYINPFAPNKENQNFKNLLEEICAHRRQLFKNKRYSFYCKTDFTRYAERLIQLVYEINLGYSIYLPEI